MISFPAALTIILAILSVFDKASCHPVKYDQRQEGDLNFRTDVDDVVFVVVPPKDLISTGMSIIAATAANLLKNHYGSGGFDRWSLRTPPKTGFAPMEKSPYKIDLGEQKVNVKKISHHGDPNRYNFHDNKNPTKGAIILHNAETTEGSALKTSSSSFSSSSSVSSSTATPTEKMKESVTESKMESNKNNFKASEKKDALESNEKPSLKPHETKTKTKTESPIVVVGEFSDGGLDPDSIFALEGCGPDAYRDQNGLCVYKSVKKES